MKDVLKRKPCATILLLFGLFLLPCYVFSMEYEHEVQFKKMSFSWKIDNQLIYIKLVAETNGWVGIGFNPSKRMQDANFVLGYVKNGKVEVTDAFGVRPIEHINDNMMEGKSNITAVSGSEKGMITTLEFAIPLDSGDPADVKINPEVPTTVLLAFGKDQDNFYSRHRFRTSLKVNLSSGELY